MVGVAALIGRRRLVAAGLAAPFVPRAGRAQSRARVVVVGGGFGGASAARALRLADPAIDVTLIERSAVYMACPFSNEVLVGLRSLRAQRFGYAALAQAGVTVIRASALAVEDHAVRLDHGVVLPFDRAILAPGIELEYAALPGYSEDAAEIMPHAWKAGSQTMRLARQIEALPANGLMVMAVPANPYRCPPGPYERASLIAHMLKAHKPRAKLIILDAKDGFSKQKLFQQAWAKLYPGVLEWVGLSDGGKVVAVDAQAGTVATDFETFHPDVANIIPPQRAGHIAQIAGVADRTGWCPIDPVTFESRLRPGLHVIGDSAIAGAMPKSAFAANAQAKVCADAVVALLGGASPQDPRLINTCYSLIAPNYGISVAGVYRPDRGVLADIPGAGGISPLEADGDIREAEARYAEQWFHTITQDVFG